MKSILYFLFRSVVSLTVFAVVWPTTYFGFEQSFWMASLSAMVAGGVTNYILKRREHHKLLNQNNLTKKEFQYIKHNLKEAHQKIKRLNKAILSIRSFRTAKLIGTLQRLVKQIYQIVKNEPKRFYQAERFFFYHLDSVVELSERYVFLSRQNVKDFEVRMSLSETEQTLEKLKKSLGDDLLTVLSNDIETLNMELDVAKKTQERDTSLQDDSSPTTINNHTDHQETNQKLLNEQPSSIKINFTDPVHREKNLVPDERSNKS